VDALEKCLAVIKYAYIPMQNVLVVAVKDANISTTCKPVRERRWNKMQQLNAGFQKETSRFNDQNMRQKKRCNILKSRCFKFEMASEPSA